MIRDNIVWKFHKNKRICIFINIYIYNVYFYVYVNIFSRKSLMGKNHYLQVFHTLVNNNVNSVYVLILYESFAYILFSINVTEEGEKRPEIGKLRDTDRRSAGAYSGRNKGRVAHRKFFGQCPNPKF